MPLCLSWEVSDCDLSCAGGLGYVLLALPPLSLPRNKSSFTIRGFVCVGPRSYQHHRPLEARAKAGRGGEAGWLGIGWPGVGGVVSDGIGVERGRVGWVWGVDGTVGRAAETRMSLCDVIPQRLSITQFNKMRKKLWQSSYLALTLL